MARTSRRPGGRRQPEEADAPHRIKRHRRGLNQPEAAEVANDLVVSDAEVAPDAASPRENVSNGEPVDQQHEVAGKNRRVVMADVARRRAAHFANFRTENGDDDEENVHVGGNDARSLGPWSSARELAEQRAAAAAAREDRLAEAQRAATALNNSTQWEPRRDPPEGPRTTLKLPSLYDLAVKLLVEYIEDVETFWGLPDAIKVSIAAAVCRCNKLSPAVVSLFTDGAPTEVVLENCTQLLPEDLVSALKLAATPRLERLCLGNCGRGLSDTIAEQVGRGQQLDGLNCLSLQGAYRLSDTGALHLLRRCPQLTQLHLPLCHNITGPLLQELPALAPCLRVLNLDQCRAISAEMLLEAAKKLPNLTTLVVNGLVEVTDGVLVELGSVVRGLQELGISKCSLLSDVGLKGLAAACNQLQVLRCDDVTKISGQGVAALAEHCKELQVLSLRNCWRVDDAALAEVAAGCCLRELHAAHVVKLGAATMTALATFCRERLEVVDLSFCRDVTDAQLGLLADSCHQLRQMLLFGCSQVSSRFLYGHSNQRLEVVGQGDALQHVKC